MIPRKQESTASSRLDTSEHGETKIIDSGKRSIEANVTRQRPSLGGGGAGGGGGGGGGQWREVDRRRNTVTGQRRCSRGNDSFLLKD